MKAMIIVAAAFAAATTGCTSAAAIGGDGAGRTQASAAAPAAHRVALPVGAMPEGIATRGSQAFVTSLRDGTIYRLDLLAGTQEVFSPPTGNKSVGIVADTHGRLFVAEGQAGTVRVLDADSGKVLASYRLSSNPQSFINDLVQVGNAVYATDSFVPALYRLPLRPDGALPEASAVEGIAVQGITYEKGFNANGIAPTPDGKALLVVQTNTGLLYRVDPASGTAQPVDIGEINLKGGDGLLLEGSTLYVVRNIPNTLTVLEMDAAGTQARLQAELRDASFDSPTTVARFQDRLYLPNARFTVAEPKNAEFDVTSIAYRP